MKYSWIAPVLVIALLLVGVGYWGYNQQAEKNQLQVYLGNQYNEGFFKLVERVEDVTAQLGKGVVATGQSQFVGICNEIWKSSMQAQESLNNLPISNSTLVDTSRFLTQVGDYALHLSRQNIQERTVTEEQRNKLQSLRSQSANLSETLLNLQDQLLDGRLKWWETIRRTANRVESEDDQLLANNFRTLVEQNEPFPNLIYDGPFSDHINQMQPKGLTGEVINKEKAREIATEFVDYPGSPNFVVKDLSDVQGRVEAYKFSVQPNDNSKNHTTIDVSKKGGHVVMYLNPRNVGEGKISRVEALNRTDQFLRSRGYSNMVPTYSWIEDNILTVSYAYKQEDVIIYPDLIKLKVAMDNGQIIGFEALGFLMSHHKRELEEVEVSEEEIRSSLDEKFTVESIRQALIPTPSLREIQTWEARVGFQEETYLLYYDIKSGDEVNILKVIDTPDGTFVE